jgi:hypothetical protein
MRIRIPSRKGDGAYFTELRNAILKHGTADRVEVNPLTAGVLIVSQAGVSAVLDSSWPAEWLELRESRPVAANRPLAHNMVEGFRSLDSLVLEVSGGELDIPSLALIGLVGAGIYQITVGNFTAPAWYTAFWYAASIALKAGNSSEPGGML